MRQRESLEMPRHGVEMELRFAVRELILREERARAALYPLYELAGSANTELEWMTCDDFFLRRGKEVIRWLGAAVE